MPRSNAKLFPGSTGSKNRYRDREVVTAPDGTKKDIQGYGSTKLEATQDFNRKAAVFIKAHASTLTMTFGQLFEKFIEHRELQGRKRKTISDYKRLYALYLAQWSETQFMLLTHGDAQAVQHELVKAGKYRTADLVVLIIRSAFAYAQRLYPDEPIRNPAALLETISAPAKDDPKDAIWTHEQIARFLDFSRTEYEKLRSLYYPLYLTSLSAGLRRGELLGLRWEHVALISGVPHIRVREQYVYDAGKLYKDTPKTAAGKRDIPISSELYAVLMSHKVILEGLEKRLPEYQPNDLVFPSFKGRVVYPSHLRRSFDRLTARAELPPIYFHSLRKCAATYITQALVDAGRYAPKIVAQILGHSRVTVAQEIYTKVVDADIKHAVFNPLATPKTLVRTWLGNENEQKPEDKEVQKEEDELAI